ncbi:tRNA pseudouridine(38-40) synthase TruA [Pelagibacteraceae bacterium]|nr:tRNA pseudouridine(38-40) synthase TruA [Pelagibacteraceae bacterium]
MFIYQILIEYDGTNFVGWQIQKNGHSIQEAIQKTLKKIFKQKIILYGSGRTDSGVHALEQSAHFSLKKKINNKLLLLNTLNFFLYKKKISILNIKERKKNFHARYSAKKRVYQYVIINRIAPLTLDCNRAWHVRSSLNILLMKKAANYLLGTKDFSTYRSSSCGAKSPIRTIEQVIVKKKKDKIVIMFKSQSFLQKQVRSMVGCLKLVGNKKWSVKKFKNVLDSKKRTSCAPPAPARGLYLSKVFY